MKAIFPGSFDPFTTGHLSIVKKAADAFDSVTVLLCHNYDKKTLFSFEERLAILSAAVEGMDRVTVDTHSGWLYEYLRKEKDAVLFKGVRNTVDFEYERKMADFNFEHSGVDTFFAISDAEMSGISSTKVRALLAEGGDWKRFIPQNAQKLVEKFYENI